MFKIKTTKLDRDHIYIAPIIYFIINLFLSPADLLSSIVYGLFGSTFIFMLIYFYVFILAIITKKSYKPLAIHVILVSFVIGTFIAFVWHDV